MLSWLKTLWNLFNLWRTLPKTAPAPKESPVKVAQTDWIEEVLNWQPEKGTEVQVFGAKVVAVLNWIEQKAVDAEYVSDETLSAIWHHIRDERENLVLRDLEVPEHIKQACAEVLQKLDQGMRCSYAGKYRFLPERPTPALVAQVVGINKAELGLITKIMKAPPIEVPADAQDQFNRAFKAPEDASAQEAPSPQATSLSVVKDLLDEIEGWLNTLAEMTHFNLQETIEEIEDLLLKLAAACSDAVHHGVEWGHELLDEAERVFHDLQEVLKELLEKKAKLDKAAKKRKAKKPTTKVKRAPKQPDPEMQKKPAAKPRKPAKKKR
jgi:hypothetical protein